MLFSRFTKKIILLTTLPGLIISAILYTVQKINTDRLSATAATITRAGLLEIHNGYVDSHSADIVEKINLKLELVRNELDVLAAVAQQQLDDYGRITFPADEDDRPLVIGGEHISPGQNFWSFNDLPSRDVRINFGPDTHDSTGRIQPEAVRLAKAMAPVIPVLDAIHSNGTDKGWVYLVGPRDAPFSIMTPWADLPGIYKQTYPDFEQQNWWEWFFPGLTEAWDGWISESKGAPGQEKDEVTLTPLYRDAAGTGLMVTFFQPLWDYKARKHGGAIGIDYNLDNLFALVKSQRQDKADFSFLIESDGNILGASPGLLRFLDVPVGRNYRKEGVHRTSFRLQNSTRPELKAVAGTIGERDFAIHEVRNSHGKEYILAFRKITAFNQWTGEGPKIVRTQLYLGMAISRDRILRVHHEFSGAIEDASRNAAVATIGLSLLLVLIALAIAAFYALRETRQIRLLVAGASAVRDKNYDTRIEVTSSDELGDLAQAFNGMTQEVRTAYTRLKDHAHLLEARVQERTRHLEAANEKLSRMTRIDGLTGISNRRHLDEILERGWRDHMRQGRPLSILLIDVDHFKKYNDVLGHPAGDDCLRQVAVTLSRTLRRPTDMVARYGGEEFCAVISGAREDGLCVAELLRKAVEALQITHPESEKGILSISIGVNSAIPDRESSLQSFIAQADQALYQAKKRGRDRTAFYDPGSVL